MGGLETAIFPPWSWVLSEKVELKNERKRTPVSKYKKCLKEESFCFRQ